MTKSTSSSSSSIVSFIWFDRLVMVMWLFQISTRVPAILIKYSFDSVTFSIQIWDSMLIRSRCLLNHHSALHGLSCWHGHTVNTKKTYPIKFLPPVSCSLDGVQYLLNHVELSHLARLPFNISLLLTLSVTNF